MKFKLSFDDGPLAGRTEKILDVLSEFKGEDGKSIKTVFFTLADPPEGFWKSRKYFAPYEIWINKGSIRKYPNLIPKIQEQGHYVGNHTTHHIWGHWPKFRKREEVRKEILGWEKIALDSGWEFTDKTRFLRAPYLITSPALKHLASEYRYQIVDGFPVGDADPRATEHEIWTRIEKQIHQTNNQNITLIFHDILEKTPSILRTITKRLIDHGHQLSHFC